MPLEITEDGHDFVGTFPRPGTVEAAEFAHRGEDCGHELEVHPRLVLGMHDDSDADGDGGPIPNAKLNLDGLSGTTDAGGHFEFVIPGDRLRPQMEIEIAVNGYEPARYTVVPNSEHVVLHLKKSH